MFDCSTGNFEDTAHLGLRESCGESGFADVIFFVHFLPSFLLFFDSVFLAVGFGMGEMCQEISDGMMVDVAFTMNINTYQGNENLQLMLKDIKF